MTDEPFPERLVRQVEFLVEIDKLKGVLRRSYVLDASRLENTAEHSWHLAMMALVLAEHADAPADMTTVLKMLVVHDLVEIDAGDTFVYDTAGAATKDAREREAADRIFALLPDDQGAELRRLWEEFDTGDSPEARFARSLDRLMPLLHNVAAEGRGWQEHGIRPDQVRDRNAVIADGSAQLWAYARSLIDTAERRGYFPSPSDEIRSDVGQQAAPPNEGLVARYMNLLE